MTPRPSSPVRHPAEIAGLSIPTPAQDPVIGRRLAGGALVIEALVERDARGVVYLARHDERGGPVSVRVLPETLQGDPDFCRRFYSLALARRRLEHPNLARVVDFGQEPDGLLFVATELLDGRTLRSVVEDDAPVSALRIREILTQLCAGLAHSHACGVVPRGLTPDDVLLVPARDADGRPIELLKVRELGFGEESSPRGAAYLSPERLDGEPPDESSDVYFCGLVMYELATGQRAFVDDDPSRVAELHRRVPPPPMSEHVRDPDPRVEAVARRALAKTRDERHVDLRALLADVSSLGACAEVPSVASSSRLPPASRVPPPAPSSSRLPPAVPPPASSSRLPPAPLASLLPPAPLSSLPPRAPPRASDRPAWLEESSEGYARFLGEAATAPREERASAIATTLTREPARWLAQLAAERDARAFSHRLADMEIALRFLAERADARALWAAVRALSGIAAEPGLRANEAATLLESFATTSTLEPVAERLLSRNDDQREAARALILHAGPRGARALYGARVKLAREGCARGVFVEVLRSLGDHGWPVARASLEAMLSRALSEPKPVLAELVEDLLLGASTETDGSAPHLVARFVPSQHPAVCAAAARALARMSGEAARPILLGLLAEADDARRAAGLGGLRQFGELDRRAVGLLLPFVSGEVPATTSLRLSAAAALAAPAAEVRAAVISELAKVFRSESLGDALVLEVGRSLFKLVGNEARAVVGARADRSQDPLRASLHALMEAAKSGPLV